MAAQGPELIKRGWKLLLNMSESPLVSFSLSYRSENTARNDMFQKMMIFSGLVIQFYLLKVQYFGLFWQGKWRLKVSGLLVGG